MVIQGLKKKKKNNNNTNLNNKYNLKNFRLDDNFSYAITQDAHDKLSKSMANTIKVKLIKNNMPGV